MNILLWVLQILLALYAAMGGFWMVRTHDKLAGAGNHALPKSAWLMLGVLQILFALGLVVPGAAGVLPGLTAVAAICLAVEMVSTAAILKAKDLWSTGMLWAVVPSLIAAFVAYGRLSLSPFGQP
jgi:hypothetical protein